MEWAGNREGERNNLARDEGSIWAYLQVSAALMLGGKTVETIANASVRIKLLNYGISLMLRKGREDNNFVELSSVK